MDLIYALLWGFFCGFILFCMGFEFRLTEPGTLLATGPTYPETLSAMGKMISHDDDHMIIMNLARLRLALFVLALIFLTCPYRTILGRLIWNDHYRFFFTRPGKLISWGLLLLFLGWCWFAEIPIYRKSMIQVASIMKRSYITVIFLGMVLRIAVIWTLIIRACEEITRKIMHKRCVELQP